MEEILILPAETQLLDHFAGLALQGMLVNTTNIPENQIDVAMNILAVQSYQIAKAMIKQRREEHSKFHNFNLD